MRLSARKAELRYNMCMNALKGKPVNKFICDHYLRLIEPLFLSSLFPAKFYTTPYTQQLADEGQIPCRYLIGPTPRNALRKCEK